MNGEQECRVRIPEWLSRSYRPVLYTILAFEILTFATTVTFGILWINHGETWFPWVLIPFVELGLVYALMAYVLIIGRHFYRHGVRRSIAMFINWIHVNVSLEVPENGR